MPEITSSVSKSNSLPDTPADFTSVPSLKIDDVESELYEAFISLRISGARGSSFYRIMVDEEETPYLDVSDILNNWLDITTECQNVRQYCQGILQPGSKLVWIDAQARQMGKVGGDVITLPVGVIKIYEDKLWLRYDIWPAWLPISSNWTLQTYALSLLPAFPLRGELKGIRDKARSMQMAMQEKGQQFTTLAVKTPQEPLRFEARYRINANYSADAGKNIALNYDVNTDILEGSFLLSGFAKDKSDPLVGFNYWQYRQVARSAYHLLEVGQSNFTSYGLLPSFSSEQAVYIEKNALSPSAGPFEWFGLTRPGSEVDVYRNGFLVKTVAVDASGEFKIDQMQVSSGDRIVIRYYFPDGSESQELIRIAPDSTLMKQGEFDTSVYIGNINDALFAYGKLRYGVSPKLSVGLHVMSLPVEEQQEEQQVLGNMLDVSWRVFPGLHTSLELLTGANALDLRLHSIYTGFMNQTWQLEFERYAKNSILRSVKNLNHNDYERFKIRHSMRFNRWNWQLLFDYKNAEQLLGFDIDYRLNRKVSIFTDTIYTHLPAGNNSVESALGANYSISSESRLEVKYAFSSVNDDSLFLNYRASAKRFKNVSYGLTATLWRDKYSASTYLNWYATKKLILALRFSQTQAMIELTWSDVLASHPGPRNYEDFGGGTLYGNVIQPPSAGETKSIPLVGVTVNAGTKKTVTDEMGSYQVSGIPPYQRTYISIGENSLDASMATSDSVYPVQFRPGTRMQYNPLLIWTAGVDGVIYRDSPIPSHAILTLKKHGSQKSFEPIKIEEDGFFLIEGLTPGTYELSLTNVDDPPSNLIFELPSQMDWLSGLEWNWR